MNHPGRPQPFWRSRTGLAFLGLFAIAAFFLFTEHRAHALGALPFLLLCSARCCTSSATAATTTHNDRRTSHERRRTRLSPVDAGHSEFSGLHHFSVFCTALPSRSPHAIGARPGRCRRSSWRCSRPDSESEQWAVADAAGAPYVVLRKIRRGDREVEVSVPDVERWRARTPVLVDDIISTARTMIETVGHLRRAQLAPPVCVGVHAVFAGTAHADLAAAGAARIVTGNTIAHESNAIDVTDLIVEAVRALGSGRPLRPVRGSGSWPY